MAVNRVKGDKPQKGQAIVNYEEKVFPDYKANPGERALFLVHTVPYEGSVAGINMLTAIRAQRKGYDVSVVFYGPLLLYPSIEAGPTLETTVTAPGSSSIPILLRKCLRKE